MRMLFSSKNLLKIIDSEEKVLIEGKLVSDDFFRRNPEVVAEELLGKILVKVEKDGILAARITETEAYLGKEDPGSHAFRGTTKRNRPMFEDPGIAYVYLCYGMYCMFNVVAHEEGKAGSVLIRSGIPLSGKEIMVERSKSRDERKVLSGPGKFSNAFCINMSHNRVKLTVKNRIFFVQDEYKIDKIERKSRVGIPYIEEDNFRFLISSEQKKERSD